MVKHMVIMLNKVVSNLYFLKLIGFILISINAKIAIKPDLKSVVTLVANVVIEKNNTIGN